MLIEEDYKKAVQLIEKYINATSAVFILQQGALDGMQNELQYALEVLKKYE